jgi:hypothetical protein
MIIIAVIAMMVWINFEQCLPNVVPILVFHIFGIDDFLHLHDLKGRRLSPSRIHCLP